MVCWLFPKESKGYNEIISVCLSLHPSFHLTQHNRHSNSTTDGLIHSNSSSGEPSWPIDAQHSMFIGLSDLPSPGIPVGHSNSYGCCNSTTVGLIHAISSWRCRCATAWSLVNWTLVEILIRHTNCHRCCNFETAPRHWNTVGPCDSTTAGPIHSISISMEPSWPEVFWCFAFTNQMRRQGTHKVGLFVVCGLSESKMVLNLINLTVNDHMPHDSWPKPHIDGFVQERHNSIANALELHLSCTNPSILFSKFLISWYPISHVCKWHPVCRTLFKIITDNRNLKEKHQNLQNLWSTLFLLMTCHCYHQTSNISHTLVGNKIVDHSDVVGVSSVGAAPTTSSFST